MAALIHELPPYGRNGHARRGIRGDLLLQPHEDANPLALLALRPSHLRAVRHPGVGGSALSRVRRRGTPFGSAGQAMSPDSLLAIGRLGHHFDVGLRFEDHAEPRTDELLVVDERDTDRYCGMGHVDQPRSGV